MNRQDSRARAEQAFRLRAVGRSWQEIADALGYRGRQSAQDAVRRHLDRTAPESPEAARRSAGEGLRIIMSTLFATLSDARQARDHQAVVATAKAISDTIDKTAKLNGLYVPVAQQVDVNVYQSASAIIDRMEAELLALAQSNPNIIEAEFVDS
jgi:hypothetical protein